MARPGDLARAQLARRIQGSRHELTVEYPPKRVGSSGATPIVAPITPLTGPAPDLTVAPAAQTAVQAPKTGIKCLWYSMPTGAGQGRPQEPRQWDLVGWREGATALARVLVSQCALDPDEPFGGTIFDTASAVVHRSGRYTVLEVARPGAGDEDPNTYYVWLATAKGQ